jgi:hypothetical protein
MDKRTTRAFAAGLLLSSILLMCYQYFYIDKNTDKTQNGYRTVKISELNKLKSDAEQWKNKYNKLQNENSVTKQKKEIPEQSLIKYHLSITSGMTPDKIGKRIKTGEIIKDDKKFVKYLIDHNFHNKIQIGEYELTSKMSFNEIAKVITKGK